MVQFTQNCYFSCCDKILKTYPILINCFLIWLSLSPFECDSNKIRVHRVNVWKIIVDLAWNDLIYVRRSRRCISPFHILWSLPVFSQGISQWDHCAVMYWSSRSSATNQLTKNYSKCINYLISALAKYPNWAFNSFSSIMQWSRVNFLAW